MKTLFVIVILSSLVISGISVSLISYAYLNYGTMTIVRLDRTLLQQPEASVNFVDVSDNISTIQKIQRGIDEVGSKYNSTIESCNNDSQGYCNGIPINAAFTIVITTNEFQMIDKAVQLKPMKISGNDTWFSNVKYLHGGCLPPAHGFQLDTSKSDNYCYYDIIVEKR